AEGRWRLMPFLAIPEGSVLGHNGVSCVDRLSAGANLSRPGGHPPLPREGPGDQCGDGGRNRSGSPLLRGEGLGVRSASGEYRIKMLNTIKAGTVPGIL